MEGGTEVSPEEVKRLLDSRAKVQLLDVREKVEFDICRLAGARLIPLGELASRLKELDKAVPVIAYCHHGRRSLIAVRLLKRHGFDAKSMEGGIDDWSAWVDPSIPKY